MTIGNIIFEEIELLALSIVHLLPDFNETDIIGLYY